MEDKNNKTRSEISSTAWSLFVSNMKDTLPTAFNFWMIALATLALGLFFPYTLIVTVPFALIPFFFAFQMTMVDGHQKGSLSSKNFFGYYLTYFREPFSGSYRVIHNAFVSFLYSLLAYFAVAFIAYYILAAVDPSFITSANEAISTLQANDTTAFYQYINDNASITRFILIVSATEETVFFLFFLHNLAKCAISPYLRLVMPGTPSRVINGIFAGTIRNIHKEFYKDYYSATWWLILLALVGYAGGFAVGYIFINLIGISGVVVAGALGTFVLVAFFLPYFVNVNSLLAKKYRNSFSDYSITLAENTLRQLQDAQRLSDEEVESLKKNIDAARSKMDQNKDNDDNKDDK